jgi:hypothetical protein
MSEACSLERSIERLNISNLDNIYLTDGLIKVITQGVNHALILWSFSSLLHMSFHYHCDKLPTSRTAKIPMPLLLDPEVVSSLQRGQPREDYGASSWIFAVRPVGSLSQ